ncbi:MAG: S9 family peptidase [Planctomycetota bacterium]
MRSMAGCGSGNQGTGAMAARYSENWKEHAAHSEPYAGRLNEAGKSGDRLYGRRPNASRMFFRCSRSIVLAGCIPREEFELLGRGLQFPLSTGFCGDALLDKVVRLLEKGSNMHSTDVPLIPRKVLFGNPDRAAVQISPDGARLAWLAPLDGVLNVWVAPRDDLAAARAVTHDTGRGIRFYLWAYTNAHILYIQDKNGDENWRLYAVDLQTNDARDLTPFEGVQARLSQVSHKFPQEVLVALNNRKPAWHDIYRINILTGERSLLLQHERFMGVSADDDYRLRHASKMRRDGGTDVYQLAGNEWQLWDAVPAEDVLTTYEVGFNKDNRLVYMKDSRGRDTAALVEINAETKEKRLLAADTKADAADVVRHPTLKHVQAVSFVYDRKRWQVLDPTIQPHLDCLRRVAEGELEIVSRSLEDRFWIVLYVVDDGPVRYYLYDCEKSAARFLFTNRAALAGQPLVKMHSAVVKSRDGLNLVVYYSLPAGSDSNGDGLPDQPVPLVFTPHGGPWGRDFWGYHPWHQWLANRGYAVMNVNFRSSTGFGKSFTNAGDLEWGGKIMDDQQDAVKWAISQGIAAPGKVAVMGGSFGGYSTLAGVTFFPKVFACGVDLVGPSSLITLLESMPPYWKPMLELFATRVGDHRTKKGRALLKKHSPLTKASRISCPLLIGQGANDPRVKQAESDQIVAALQAKKIPVAYVLYPDEGHGFARPENNLSFYAIAEAFLARCLGGRHEPIGSDFAGSSLTVPTGAEEVPGLVEALAEKPPEQKQ